MDPVITKLREAFLNIVEEFKVYTEAEKKKVVPYLSTQRLVIVLNLDVIFR